MIGRSILILGGARSGKTRRALALGEPFAERFYIATGEALDAEMADRIARHRRERGAAWTTVEAPLDLPAAMAGLPDGAVGVVDCLTLWLSNLLGAGREVAGATDELLRAIRSCPATLLIVSNEVGLGLVPETPLGRAFRDEQGRLNQAVAAAVAEVEFVAAGLPLRLKP
jgi:adenosylcobinamide kinase / adenosylcobinamide-phosphate guanylyltransferase